MIRPAFDAAQRVVIKAGSALLNGGSGPIDAIASDIAALMDAGKQVVLVSSGAVALGRPRLNLPDGALSLEQKQAAAAAGQPVLVRTWDTAFSRHGRSTAQTLITLDVTEHRRRWLNARATVNTLLDCGLIPVVNENDTVATDEIRYGDNDRLAARVAQMIGADLLVLLSDVDGLYTADPGRDPDAELIPDIDRIDDRIRAMAGGPMQDSGVGTGGMRTKIMAADMAANSGCATLIGLGTETRPVMRLRDPAIGTCFHPVRSSRKARESWIAGSLGTTGIVHIDAGAEAALRQGKSLLPIGAVRIEGAFERGDTLRILAPDGRLAGYGISAYDAADAERICGCHTRDIESVLGYRRASVLVHADDLVISGPDQETES